MIRVDIFLDNPGFNLTDAEVHHSDPPKSSVSDIQSRLVCLSPPWLALVMGLRFPLFDAVPWLHCLYGVVDS